jgi:hypothetical protein
LFILPIFKQDVLNQLFKGLKLKELLRQPLFLFHVLAVIALSIFIWRHAFNMDITYDESYSFRLIRHQFRAMPGSPNNHWLNSFFMKLFNLLFGDEPGYLRLHSITSFPFFAHGIYRLTPFIRNRAAQFTFYCIAIFNPFVLDFFSLARGYAMAVTFQVWAILFLIQAASNIFSYRQWLKIIIVSAFSIAANLSYVYTVIGMTGVFFLHCIAANDIWSWFLNKHKRIISLLFVLLILFSIADMLVIKLYNTDMDIENHGFVNSLFYSFWSSSLYFSRHESMALLLSYGTLMAITLSVLYFTVKYIYHRKSNAGLIAAVIVGIIFILNLIFHFLFKVPYFEHRWAIQWYIPGLLSIHAAVSEWLISAKRFSIVQYGISALTGIIVIYHCVQNSNTQLCYAWSYQAGNKKIFSDLYAQRPQHPLISSRLHVLYANYYSVVNKTLTPAVELDEEPGVTYTGQLKQTMLNSDYLIVQLPSTLQFLDSCHVPYMILKSYPLSQSKLIKINHGR